MLESEAVTQIAFSSVEGLKEIPLRLIAHPVTFIPDDGEEPQHIGEEGRLRPHTRASGRFPGTTWQYAVVLFHPDCREIVGW